MKGKWLDPLRTRTRYTVTKMVPWGTGDHGTRHKCVGQDISGRDIARIVDALEGAGERVTVFHQRRGGLGTFAYATTDIDIPIEEARA